MENLKKPIVLQTLGVGLIIVALVFGWVALQGKGQSSVPSSQLETVNTPTEEGESIEVEKEEEITIIGSTNVPTAQTTVETNSQTTAVVQQEVQTPRKEATSPAEALQYFALAQQAQDIERALTYFHPSVQEQYRNSFETEYKNKIHPVALAYTTGKVDDVQLVEPRQGLYEIAVYPAGSQIPFRPRFVYESTTGEFVILEL